MDISKIHRSDLDWQVNERFLTSNSLGFYNAPIPNDCGQGYSLKLKIAENQNKKGCPDTGVANCLAVHAKRLFRDSLGIYNGPIPSDCGQGDSLKLKIKTTKNALALVWLTVSLCAQKGFLTKTRHESISIEE